MSTPTTWIAVDRVTGQAVAELFLASTADRVNRERYEVVTALEWLQRLNRQIKAGVR